MKIGLLDLGIGNLHSLAKALTLQGAEVEVTTDPRAALAREALVLPGVGAFGPAAERIAAVREPLAQRLRDGHPCLGICLGMQLLFTESDEAPGAGIGLFDDRVRQLRAARTPQMGWNEVEPGDDPLFDGLERPIVYYANRYVVAGAAGGRTIGWTRYGGDRFPAAVRTANTWGTQFHPEKSGADGLRILRGFLRAAGGGS